jgi:hypothetical protein
MKTDDQTKSALKDQIDQLKDSVEVAVENGLYQLVKDQSKDAIERELVAALEEFAKGDLTKAEVHRHNADVSFSEAWNKAGIAWRLRHEWGLGHHLATVVSAVIGFLLLSLLVDCHQTLFPKDICVVGILGAVLRGLYWVQYRANQRVLRNVWLGSFLFAAPIGAILAVVTYWAICANLLLFSSSETKASPPHTPYSAWVLCFYASFQWQWALKALTKASAKTK